MPAANHLHVAGMLRDGKPPPGNGKPRDHDPVVAVAPRPFLHSDIHELKLAAVRPEPEVEGVLFLGLVLVVEDRIGEPAIAAHAANNLHLLEDQIEIGVELGIVEDEHAVLRTFRNDSIDGLLYLGLADVRCQRRQRGQIAKSHRQGRGSCNSKSSCESKNHHWLVESSGSPPEGGGALADRALPVSYTHLTLPTI